MLPRGFTAMKTSNFVPSLFLSFSFVYFFLYLYFFRIIEFLDGLGGWLSELSE